ncbi:MAG: TonB-dependent receptor [bacterium]
MIRLVLLTLISLITFTAQAESASAVKYYKGVIVDDKTGETIAGAAIQVEGSVIGCFSDKNGEFKISLSKYNNVVLVVSSLGYETVTISATDNDMTIKMTESLTDIDEVVITGSRAPRPLKEVPVLTRVVSSADIERINPMDFQSLMEYEIPGLQFGRAHGSNLPEITFQGVTGEYVLFLINGERIAGEGSSDNIDFSRLNVDDIERVEIIRGAMSTLYGSSAMGGVINIITKDAKRPFAANISSRLNSYGGHKHYVSAETKLNKFTSYTSGGYTTEDAYSVTDATGGSTSMSGYQINNATQRFGYSITDNLKLNVNGSYYQNNQLEYATTGKSQDVFRSYSGGANLLWVINKNHNIKASYLNDNYTKHEEYSSGATAKKEYHDIQHIARIEYSGEIADKHTIIGGVEFNQESLLHYRIDLTGNDFHTQQNYVSFVQEEWKITNKLNIVAGVRLDYNSDYGANFSPKISAMYRLYDFSFRGGFAIGFRQPSLRERYEEYDMGGLGMFTIYGNEDLTFERSNQYSLSTEYNKNGFNISVSGYYNKFDNKIAMALMNDGTSNYQYYNAENASTGGVDVATQYRLKFGLTLKASYSYVNCFEELNGYNVSSTRPHSANINAQYSFKIGKYINTNVAFNGRWVSSVNAWYEDSSTGEMTYTTYDSRTICGANIGFKFPRGINCIFQVDNIFDFEDANISSDATLIPERGISCSGTININVADLFKLK